MPGVKGRSGGRRAGAGRPRKTPLPVPVEPRVVVETPPEVRDALTGIRALLEAQNALLTRQQQQRRNEYESGPAILQRLTELERLVRGDPGLARVPRTTRRRPLGIES